MEIKDILRALLKKGVSSSILYNIDKDQLYLDLETGAKSELHLFEDGVLRGRYQYEKQIDLTQDIEDLITELCYEFKHALHGRDYYQEGWAELCRSKGITLEIYKWK